MNNTMWYGKPYYSLSAYLKNTYGRTYKKIAVDAGFNCPNRDGTLDTTGCIFCSEGGSGDFAVSLNDALAIADNTTDNKYIIYFQAFTCTYADVGYLHSLYTKALNHPSVIGISIATRPDCLGLPGTISAGSKIMPMLSELNTKYSIQDKFIWIELGLQTIHEDTASYIKRHYPLPVYDKAVSALNDAGIPYITHIILGLPNESVEMMLNTVRYVCRYKPFGIKLQLLHVLKGTQLADDYSAGYFKTLELNEYLEIIIKCIQNIPKDIVIHRVTGDGPKNLLIAPKWSEHKRHVLNSLHRLMKEKNAIQGDYTLS